MAAVRAAAAMRARLGAHPARKLAVLLGLAVGICVPYFALQRVALFPLRAVPVTGLDHWITFDPAWVWAYASIALLVPLAPLLASSREELARYAVGLTLLCLPCFAAYLLLPVEGPRPAAATSGTYGLIVAYDHASNSLPSLHAGLTVFSLLYARRVMWPGLGAAGRSACAALGAAWAALILYSTLATKQHWAVDLPPGILAAGVAHALAWRSAGPLGARAPARLPGADAQALRRARASESSTPTPVRVASTERY